VPPPSVIATCRTIEPPAFSASFSSSATSSGDRTLRANSIPGAQYAGTRTIGETGSDSTPLPGEPAELLEGGLRNCAEIDGSQVFKPEPTQFDCLITVGSLYTA
jgi:hypothetical protein